MNAVSMYCATLTRDRLLSSDPPETPLLLHIPPRAEPQAWSLYVKGKSGAAVARTPLGPGSERD